jgi:hypothetical protein
MTIERITKKEELLYKLGRLFGPLEQFVARGDDANNEERSRVLARYTAEHQTLIEEFRDFSRGEPGHDYRAEFEKFYYALYLFPRHATQTPEKLSEFINEALSLAKDAIRGIPVYPESQILETRTPFSTYCKLKAIANLTASTLIFVDRYLHQSIFFRYLSDLQPSTVVTLVGPKRIMTDSFLDISRLFALERGPEKYRLMSVPSQNIHDRWVQFDSELLQLGNSTARAAMINDFTIARLDPSAENFNILRVIVNSAIEQFGPTNITHPQTSADLV